MAATLIPQFLVGTTFGTALLLSGVSNPNVIVSQFTLENFDMLIAFLTASSLSAAIVYGSNASGYAKLEPRSCSNYGWLGRYGGNIIGGVMQGIGMAVSGACPGTVLVQTALGWGKGSAVLLGSILGGGLFILFGDKLKDKKLVRRNNRSGEVKTLQETLGVTTEQMVVLYEVIMASVITSASMFAPVSSPWQKAMLGGCMIGVAQASSVLLSRKTLGVSTAFQDTAGHIFSSISKSVARPGWGSIVFAAGAMTGAKVVNQYARLPIPAIVAADISTTAAVVGGAMSIFGARLAGGCTSGHGISGCSTLSISSVITVASMFGGGIAYKLLLA